MASPIEKLTGHDDLASDEAHVALYDLLNDAAAEIQAEIDLQLDESDREAA